jgi:Family of unknown function (DUF5681)
MSEPNPKNRKALAVLPNRKPYTVGHGKPPEATRFKPGRSGNPKGRPKGSKNARPALHDERMKSIILDEAYRAIKVNDGSKQVSVPMAQAIMRSLAVTAAKGNIRAQRLFAQLLATTENIDKQKHDAWLEAAITYKAKWEQELERRASFESKAPDPIPHPDDIIINFRTGKVEVHGPMSKEEFTELNQWLARKNDFEEELEILNQSLDDPEHEGLEHLLRDDLQHTRKVLAIINQAIESRASSACVGRTIKIDRKTEHQS